VEVFPDLLVTGAIRHVNVTMIEWHAAITGPGERKELMDVLAKGVSAVANVTNAFKLYQVMEVIIFVMT